MRFTSKRTNSKTIPELLQKQRRLKISYYVAVDQFCKNQPSVHAKAVTSTVAEITRLRQQMVVNILAIGHRLSELRNAIGCKRFSEFMKDVLPMIGISRSTGYRWLGLSEKLGLLFPNPLIREQLMLLTDGKGIVTTIGNNDKKSLKLVLTASAQEALKSLPPPPEAKRGQKESEQWVQQFVTITAKARSELRVPSGSLPKDREAITRRFIRFASLYGTQAAEDLCGDLDKTLNQIVESTDTSASCPQSRSHENTTRPARILPTESSTALHLTR